MTEVQASSTADAPTLSGLRAGAFACYRVLIPLFALAVLVGIFLAGLGVFGATSSVSASPELNAHRDLGRQLTTTVPLVLLLLAALARPGRRILPMTALLLVVGIAQMLLGVAGGSTAWLGGLHTILAFFYLGLAGNLVKLARGSG